MGAEGVRGGRIRFNLSGKRTENLYNLFLGSFCTYPESNHIFGLAFLFVDAFRTFWFIASEYPCKNNKECYEYGMVFGFSCQY